MAASIVAVAGAAWFGTPRAAGYLLALVLASLACARAVLPENSLPLLAIRSRPIDVTLCLGLACLVALVSAVLP